MWLTIRDFTAKGSYLSDFKQIMEKEDCTMVTGHHANQAETTLMRLIRGTKLRHLSGIPVQPFGQVN